MSLLHSFEGVVPNFAIILMWLCLLSDMQLTIADDANPTKNPRN